MIQTVPDRSAVDGSVPTMRVVVTIGDKHTGFLGGTKVIELDIEQRERGFDHQPRGRRRNHVQPRTIAMRDFQYTATVVDEDGRRHRLNGVVPDVDRNLGANELIARVLTYVTFRA